MRGLRFVLALLLATTVQMLGQRHGSFFLATDLLLLAAVYNSLESGPAGSMLGGTAAGLVQDTLTGGLFGLHGFANTLVAWAVVMLRQRLSIQQPLQIGLAFALAAALQLASIASLEYWMLPGAALPGIEVMVLRMVTTGILGVLTVTAVDRVRTRLSGWRHQRQQRLRLGVD